MNVIEKAALFFAPSVALICLKTFSCQHPQGTTFGRTTNLPNGEIKQIKPLETP